jgi:hypothetical protein
MCMSHALGLPRSNTERASASLSVPIKHCEHTVHASCGYVAACHRQIESVSKHGEQAKRLKIAFRSGKAFGDWDVPVYVSVSCGVKDLQSCKQQRWTCRQNVSSRLWASDGRSIGVLHGHLEDGIVLTC